MPIASRLLPPHAPAAAPRPPRGAARPGWAMTLVAAWLLAMAALALWRLPPPAVVIHDPAALAAWEAWWSREGASLAGGGPLLRVGGCACGEVPGPPALPGVTVARVEAAGPEALLFDASGRLRYAGPLRDPAFCGGGSPLQAVAAQLDRPLPALMVDAPCGCAPTLAVIPPPMGPSA